MARISFAGSSQTNSGFAGTLAAQLYLPSGAYGRISALGCVCLRALYLVPVAADGRRRFGRLADHKEWGARRSDEYGECGHAEKRGASHSTSLRLPSGGKTYAAFTHHRFSSFHA